MDGRSPIHRHALGKEMIIPIVHIQKDFCFRVVGDRRVLILPAEKGPFAVPDLIQRKLVGVFYANGPLAVSIMEDVVASFITFGPSLLDAQPDIFSIGQDAIKHLKPILGIFYPDSECPAVDERAVYEG